MTDPVIPNPNGGEWIFALSDEQHAICDMRAIPMREDSFDATTAADLAAA
jgi:hypothetical protein